MRTFCAATSVAAAAVLLAGCASAPAEPAEGEAGGNADTSSSAAPAGTTFTLDQITSCDQVEKEVAPYIDALVPAEGNVVDEWGVSCTWETAEGETDLANIRSVSVQLAPVEAGTEKPDPSGVAGMEGGSLVEDAWVTKHDGVAFSLDLGTAVAGATSTTVWVPGVEANIGGGQWDGMPALDGPAAVELVRALIG